MNKDGINDAAKTGASISKRSFFIAIAILFLLMAVTYALTFIIPPGAYERTVSDGRETVVPGTYRETEGGMPFWKWLCSPILVLGAEGNVTVIAIIVFLLVIGGVFAALESSGILRYMLSKIYYRYSGQKYKMLCLISLFFMALGAFVGSFEECVPMVPIAVALAVSMGWDELTGLGMSLLAIGCGFATGVLNPFTVGVAQELMGLPMFSGVSFRLISFAVIYALLVIFLTKHAKKVESTPPAVSAGAGGLGSAGGAGGLGGTGGAGGVAAFQKDAKKDAGLTAFAAILGAGVLIILSSAFNTVLQGIIMPVIALIFLAAGLSSVLISGTRLKTFGKEFLSGMAGILPAVLLILMASSIKYTMEESRIMDTLLFNAVKVIEGTPVEVSLLLVYGLILGMNFFISSGSAKAFLLIPLIAPLVSFAGISEQTAVLAFAYGDGFSNVFYATNPVLLISLGLANVSYGRWVRFTAKLQGLILLVTCGLLMLAHYVGY